METGLCRNDKKGDLNHMRIGITERGDAGLDLTWKDKLNQVDGVVLVTKNLNQHFRTAVLDSMGTKPIIVHATITGWGGTPLEPHVPNFQTSIQNLQKLIQDGFPLKQCVLRIDPIIPFKVGLDVVNDVLSQVADCPEQRGIRGRVSILDEYQHVKQRLQMRGLSPFYPNGRFQASRQQKDDVLTFLRHWNKKENIIFETCAEPDLLDPAVVQQGCISPVDLQIMNLPVPQASYNNPQNRYGCLCLGCKTELLTRKQQCPHGCLYCYWR